MNRTSLGLLKATDKNDTYAARIKSHIYSFDITLFVGYFGTNVAFKYINRKFRCKWNQVDAITDGFDKSIEFVASSFTVDHEIGRNG